MDRIKDRKGEIMLEGLIVFIVTIFLLFMLIAMFGVMFQRWNMQTVANDAAARTAQIYKYVNMGDRISTVTGEIELDNALDADPYRYMFFNEAGFKMAAETRAEDYALERLEKSMFLAKNKNMSVTAVVKSDFLGRRHIEVEITHTFVVPFHYFIEKMGFGEALTFTVTGYADCVDMSDYLNTIQFTKYVTDPNHWFKSDVIKAINGVLELINEFF